MNLFELFPSFRSGCPRPCPDVPQHAVIALGGGGARGIAHLGVMQAINESGFITDRIVGVSMGAMMGALCAVDPRPLGAPLRAQAKVMELLRSPVFLRRQEWLLGSRSLAEKGREDDGSSGGVFSWYKRLKGYLNAHHQLTRAVTRESLLPASPLIDSIAHLLPDIDLQDTVIPLSVVAVDLLSGHRVVLENGSLRRAVQASMAIPGIFPPVRWGNLLLSDIGVMESLPTLIAQSYSPDFTIVVDVGQNPTQIAECPTALDVMMRMEDISERWMRRHAVVGADLVIRPDVGNTAWFDFNQPQRLIESGYQAFPHNVGGSARRNRWSLT